MHGYLHVVLDHTGHPANREFAELPAVCPFCQHHGQPFRLAACATDAEDRAVDFAFQCSRPSCRRLFVVSYHRGPDGDFELDDAGPTAQDAARLKLHA